MQINCVVYVLYDVWNRNDELVVNFETLCIGVHAERPVCFGSVLMSSVHEMNYGSHLLNANNKP